MARILLIEDNRDHLELMAYLLRSHGHVPLSAGSAESGRIMIECCQELDLIICDIALGGASGIDLVRTLRKSGRLSSVPIVAVTAGSMGQAHEAFAAGFDRYLLKPIEPETFVAEVTGCLAERAHFPSARGAGTAPPAAPISTTQEKPHATILAVDHESANPRTEPAGPGAGSSLTARERK
jgi:CheY-like chemotaxis protein